ncbi:sugar transferase [Peristeroidobacter agariperforans]|uniref:sugar transferase n=1 Tax=Peristeroidobacter agariperforans TaxID=268404 RepID=UPI00101B9DA7|nr:sugar transferase [Peristeroidobacter agariperforans]
MKRLLDILLSLVGLVLASPVLLPVMFLIWWQDKHSPFYVAPRVGMGERPFRMVKLRSMIINADKSGVDSTSSSDRRITPVGQFVRRYKLDELTQLWNVLKGDMSLVGPRPNVERETRMYTPMEKKLLGVRPGITDYASIVFSDEGEILRDKADPDIAYNQLIRPYKGVLGLFYIEHSSWLLDLKLIYLTAIAVFSRDNALRGVVRDLQRRGAPPEVLAVAARVAPLVPAPPPGATQIVTERY